MIINQLGVQAPQVRAVSDATDPTNHPEPLAISIDEAARLTGTSRSFIYGLIRSGALQTKHLGRRNLVVRDSLMELLAKDETEGVESL
jgi:excisionase family DNA binding protein